jgi:hypothetical protein
MPRRYICWILWCVKSIQNLGTRETESSYKSRRANWRE